ncbi:hypothetical protein AUC71_15025 [Methyloceanibacter marginalis]|uniref:Uncharacterized protein n=1 Tax=Methyloceanibacter marginalis TaxID=1774971 RepID=A0A1E3W9P6_9HYPH|nr:toprim domain-containing protein [Methyloceanibacter marginalis]ODS02496.1 hypothetical protein AUC71_15025 [Methyloceanibacter marginalis]
MALARALVAPGDPPEATTTIHRTWLARDGLGKADFDKNKMALSEWSGGVIRLAPIAAVLGVAEGIETALSVTQLTGIACWSAMAAGNFEKIELPPGVREVHAFADDDPAGIDAAMRAVRRWEAAGLETYMRLPPEGFNDYNDVLTGKRKK